MGNKGMIKSSLGCVIKLYQFKKITYVSKDLRERVICKLPKDKRYFINYAQSCLFLVHDMSKSFIVIDGINGISYECKE